MSATTYEPLRAVPPLTDQHVRMGLLLRLQRTARRAVDAAMAATRGAAEYARRLVSSLELSSSLSWARRIAGRLLRPVAALGARVGRSGALAAVTAVVTSPTGQAVLMAAGRALRTAGGWLARKAYSLLDRGLRSFGAPGNRAADKLFGVLVSIGGRVAEVAAPVVHRVARFSDAQAPHVRLLSSLVRSYALHRVLKAFVANPWLRLLVEAVLVPALLDSRAAAWLRAGVRDVRVRAERLREQADTMNGIKESGHATAAGAAEPRRVIEDDDLVARDEAPMPSNRAERRAAERQQRRHQQH